MIMPPLRIFKNGQSRVTDRIIVFTDGSASPNPGPGGYGVLFLYPDGREETLSGSAPHTTNNIMELSAAIAALEHLPAGSTVEIVTDSEYLKNGITKWIQTWQRNGWRTSARKPVLNLELWQRLYELTRRHDVRWRWTRAHIGTPENERANHLANAARKRHRKASTAPSS